MVIIRWTNIGIGTKKVDQEQIPSAAHRSDSVVDDQDQLRFRLHWMSSVVCGLLVTTKT